MKLVFVFLILVLINVALAKNDTKTTPPSGSTKKLTTKHPNSTRKPGHTTPSKATSLAIPSCVFAVTLGMLIGVATRH